MSYNIDDGYEEVKHIEIAMKKIEPKKFREASSLIGSQEYATNKRLNTVRDEFEGFAQSIFARVKEAERFC